MDAYRKFFAFYFWGLQCLLAAAFGIYSNMPRAISFENSIQCETFINILLKSQVIHIYALLKVGLRTVFAIARETKRPKDTEPEEGNEYGKGRSEEVKK